MAAEADAGLTARASGTLFEASPADHDERGADRLADKEERQGEPGAKAESQRGGGHGQLRSASATLPQPGAGYHLQGADPDQRRAEDR